MNPITIRYPKKLVFGSSVFDTFVEDIIARGFKKVFIVTIPQILTDVEKRVAKLKQYKIEAIIDTSIQTEPTFESFTKVLNHAREYQVDSVVGIGGGSSLDVAKLVAAQLENDQSITEILGIENLKQRTTYLACLPTTAGTGSEVSPNAILLDESDYLKKGVISPYLVPDAAYVDPLLTLTVPPSVTAATGLDALTHCIEAYANKFAHPMIDLYALEGIRLISAHLERAVRDGSDVTAREKLALGSLYGGLCLGPVNTAAVHALSYPLGGSFHIPHGLSNAILLPYVMKFNMEMVPERYANIARALGIQFQGDTEEIALAGVEKVKDLLRNTNVPLRLSELNIPRNAIPIMAEGALKVTRLLKNNLRRISLQDAIEIYEEAY